MFGIEIYMCLYIIYMGPFIHRPVLHLSVSAVSYKVPSGAAVHCMITRIDPVKDAIASFVEYSSH